MKNNQCFCQMWSLIPRNTEVSTLNSCIASILKQWTCHIWPDAPFWFIMMVLREQIQAFWQSPIDHHSIYWLYFFLLADTLDVDKSLGWVEFEGLRSCQMWVFNKFDWIFHKFTENGEFYIVWFLALTRMIETPAFWGDFGNILAVLKWFGHVKLFCV